MNNALDNIDEEFLINEILNIPTPNLNSVDAHLSTATTATIQQLSDCLLDLNTLFKPDNSELEAENPENVGLLMDKIVGSRNWNRKQDKYYNRRADTTITELQVTHSNKNIRSEHSSYLKANQTECYNANLISYVRPPKLHSWVIIQVTGILQLKNSKYIHLIGRILFDNNQTVSNVNRFDETCLQLVGNDQLVLNDSFGGYSNNNNSISDWYPCERDKIKFTKKKPNNKNPPSKQKTKSDYESNKIFYDDFDDFDLLGPSPKSKPGKVCNDADKSVCNNIGTSSVGNNTYDPNFDHTFCFPQTSAQLKNHSNDNLFWLNTKMRNFYTNKLDVKEANSWRPSKILLNQVYAVYNPSDRLWYRGQIVDAMRHKNKYSYKISFLDYQFFNFVDRKYIFFLDNKFLSSKVESNKFILSDVIYPVNTNTNKKSSINNSDKNTNINYKTKNNNSNNSKFTSNESNSSLVVNDLVLFREEVIKHTKNLILLAHIDDIFENDLFVTLFDVTKSSDKNISSKSRTNFNKMSLQSINQSLQSILDDRFTRK